LLKGPIVDREQGLKVSPQLYYIIYFSKITRIENTRPKPPIDKYSLIDKPIQIKKRKDTSCILHFYMP
jgi:hypothetical protein